MKRPFRNCGRLTSTRVGDHLRGRAVGHSEAIERLLSALKQKYTIVIVRHNMAQARRASDDCVFMLLGEVIEHGPTPEMFLRPKRSARERVVTRTDRLNISHHL